LLCLSVYAPRGLARKLLGGTRALPALLRGKWCAVALFALYLVAYEVFALWDSPWWTAWIAVGYFAAAFLIDGLYGGASFCRSLCPIGNFQFAAASVSPLEFAPRSADVCESCTTQDCLRGGPRGPGCEFDLYQPAKVGNLDCTFCFDCARACPHENVALRLRLPGSELVSDAQRAGVGRLSTRRDLTAFALVFCFGAFANAAAMLAPVAAFEQALAARLGIESEWLLTLALLCFALVGCPALLCALLSRAGFVLASLSFATEERRRIARRFVFALIPLGFAMWLAHFVFHLGTAGGTLAHVATRLKGFDLRSASLLPPDALLPFEITALGVGLWITLFVAWRVALDVAKQWRPALGLFTPWALLASALWLAGLWILFQPMEMRGMVMG